jgi:homoserine dehydrogenase
MHEHPLIVLKFGGSVLADHGTLRRAVHEIYRWRREGWRVVAVISALAGETDRWLDLAAESCPQASPQSIAAIGSLGEFQSAAHLALALDRAGLPATLLSPAAVGLVAAGDPRDAHPVSLNTHHFQAAFAREHAIVFPGFAATDDLGRTVTLGRGGSDLTALHLARFLQAHRCRLIKDVDGLYTADPARPGPTPDRYGHASYADALATDGSIIQHKAIHYAQQHQLSFEIARVNGSRPTTIGPGPSRLDRTHDRPTPLRVALLGPGTVGQGVCDLVQGSPDLAHLAAVFTRDPAKPRDVPISHTRMTTSALDAIDRADVVIETIGSFDPAHQLVLHALHLGIPVITANKALLATHGPDLARVAREHGTTLFASAAVGGSTTVLERIRARTGQSLRSVRGVLNGTTNFVLDQRAAGINLDEAVASAQQRGFAEADPSRDLDGIDAADKLRVIAQCAGVTLPTDCLSIEPLAVGLRRLSAVSAQRTLRSVATLVIEQAARAHARVELEALAPDDALVTVHGAHNAVELIWSDSTREFIHGCGAGRWPTAEAVFADLLELCRSFDLDRIHISPEVQYA